MHLARPVSIKLAAALLGVAALVAVAVAGSAAAKTDGGVAKATKASTVTLLVWDQEVRGGQNATMNTLNKAFMAKYPNIKINRVAKSFTDLQKTLKLAASGPNPPDVVEANNGYSAMGPLVKANLLLSLSKYVTQYGWKSRYSAGVLRMNEFTSDAKHFGVGHLYGLPLSGEIVGVFYNKANLKKAGVRSVPTTFAQFQTALAKAKAAGQIPIQFGNLDKWPGIHEFEEVMLQYVTKPYARSFIFGTNPSTTSFHRNGTIAAAAKLRQWANAGYFTSGYNGLGYDPSSSDFSKGKGLFMITGSWQTSLFGGALRKNVGFFLLPPPSGRALATLGGEGLPWSVSSKTKNPDAAAMYLNFITNAHSQQVAATNGVLTASNARVKVPAGLYSDVNNQYTRANIRDAIVPYLDWSTPTMYDTITAAIQELLAGKKTPTQFVDTVQSDYAKFHSGH
jgi:raffinose/stachyose/melibiose transport system substrate-binding protein